MEKNNLTYINVEDIHPHPDNPRKVLTDIEELAESIKAKGVMQNLTVVPREAGGYTAIIGHRRLAASKLAGLTEVPCVVVEMSYKEQLGTMLLENIQRSDLTVIEQAQGFQMMIDLGETIETVADKTGFSKSTVKRRIEIAKLDREKLAAAAERKQLTIGDLDKVAQIESIAKRNEVISSLGTNNFEYALNKAIKDEKIAKALPGIKEQLKELKGKKLLNGEQHSSKYECFERLFIKDWTPGEPILKKKAPDELFYMLNEGWGEVLFYKKTPKAKKPKKTAAEIAREQYIDETWRALKSIGEAAYESRKAFIEGLNVNAKNIDIIARGATALAFKATYSYISSPSATTLYEMFKVDSNDYTGRSRKIVAGIMSADKTLLPKIIYECFGDNADNTHICGHIKNFPIHKDSSDVLDLLYDWLEQLGYEMSDEERQLKDGTHPLFVDKDEKEN